MAARVCEQGSPAVAFDSTKDLVLSCCPRCKIVSGSSVGVSLDPVLALDSYHAVHKAHVRANAFRGWERVYTCKLIASHVVTLVSWQA